MNGMCRTILFFLFSVFWSYVREGMERRYIILLLYSLHFVCLFIYLYKFGILVLYHHFFEVVGVSFICLSFPFILKRKEYLTNMGVVVPTSFPPPPPPLPISFQMKSLRVCLVGEAKN